MSEQLVKNQELTVEITDLTYEGAGVAKVDGYPLFIENTLPGEKAIIRVMKTGKKFGFAKLVKLIETSPERVVIDDDQKLRMTGIAPLQHMTYASQLAFKQQQVQNVFLKQPIGDAVKVLSTKGMADPSGYRNKAQVPVRRVDKELTTGFFRKNSHDLVSIEDFLIQDPKIDQLILFVRDCFRRYGVKAYNEKGHTGLLRHIIVRKGYYSGEIMLVLVTTKLKFFRVDQMIEEIVEAFPEVVSVIQNIQPNQTNVILGKEDHLLYGKAFITDTLLGKEYQISAHSFYQINPVQAEVLYKTAIDFAQLKPTDVVIDAYCGIGTIGLSLADHVQQVYGMEVIADAIEDAKTNADHNGITNIDFMQGKAEELMVKFVESGKTADVLVVDPPRKGLTNEFLEATVTLNTPKIVYISCNPATLARDCQYLADHGYKVKQVQPVDMFPQTTHVESVALLVKQ